jgi:hypothetical protein
MIWELSEPVAGATHVQVIQVQDSWDEENRRRGTLGTAHLRVVFGTTVDLEPADLVTETEDGRYRVQDRARPVETYDEAIDLAREMVVWWDEYTRAFRPHPLAGGASEVRILPDEWDDFRSFQINELEIPAEVVENHEWRRRDLCAYLDARGLWTRLF